MEQPTQPGVDQNNNINSIATDATNIGAKPPAQETYTTPPIQGVDVGAPGMENTPAAAGKFETPSEKYAMLAKAAGLLSKALGAAGVGAVGAAGVGVGMLTPEEATAMRKKLERGARNMRRQVLKRTPQNVKNLFGLGSVTVEPIDGLTLEVPENVANFAEDRINDVDDFLGK